jgi:beta-glucosidase
VLGEFGAALSRSVQEEGVIACPKHFALNSIEDLRFYVDVTCDDRTLHEVYLPHFKRCIDEGALAVMGAYNRYDQFHCCENKKLLTDILRTEWGFDGFVMSDFFWGVYDAEHSLRAGLDIEMMFTTHYSKRKLKKLLKKGALHEGLIDRAVAHILSVLIRLIPRMKPRSREVVGCREHRALALEAAEKGMVLLKNQGVLPLKKDTPVMVTGPYADMANVGDYGSSRVFDDEVVTPYAGISRTFTQASLSEGVVAVVCVGSNNKKEGEYFINSKYSLNEKPKDGGGDRASLRLEPEEVALIKTLKQQGKKVVVVLYSGCAIITEEWKDYADAIIMNYYSGCEGGTALAHLLCGDKNFTGHLPFTVARREEDYPPFLEMGQKPYEINYGYYHGYALFDKEQREAAYPFGFGLSYSDYAIEDIKVVQEGHALRVTAKMTNKGTMDGADVLQVYVGSCGASDGADRPVKQLKGFKRVELRAGESQQVELAIPLENLRFWTPGGWVLDPSYRVFVGDDSQKAMQSVHQIVIFS